MALGLEQALQLIEVHITLERMVRFRVRPFGNHQVQGRDAGVFKVGTGGVEMGVIRNNRVRSGVFSHDRGQDMFGRPSLMRGNDVFERHQIFNRIPEPVIGRRARIRFITAHQRGPLRCAHG